eukprot:1945276-Pleurochrysis_carterae.AAC.1
MAHIAYAALTSVWTKTVEGLVPFYLWFARMAALKCVARDVLPATVQAASATKKYAVTILRQYRLPSQTFDTILFVRRSSSVLTCIFMFTPDHLKSSLR